jgi:flagellar biosynthesis/type III secretory pathway M-ring protein FliF/YscJ
MTSDGKLRLIGSGALLPQLATANPANNLGISTWLIIGVGAVVAAVVLRLGWLALKMSRLRRKARAAKKAETAEKKPDESTDPDPTTWF